MSSNYSGVIKKVFEKNGRQSFLMDDDNWYGLGHNKMDAQDGDKAKFEWESNSKNGTTYKNVVKGTCKVKKGSGSAGGGGKGQSDYKERQAFWAEKEIRDIETQQKISYAGALNTSVHMVTSMIEKDLLKLGGKKADAWNAFEAFVNDLAETLYVRIQSQPKFHEQLMERATSPTQEEPEGTEAPDDEPFEDEDEDEDW